MAVDQSEARKNFKSLLYKRGWIYHVPTASAYKATHPEECFATEAAAQAAGYRKALR